MEFDPAAQEIDWDLLGDVPEPYIADVLAGATYAGDSQPEGDWRKILDGNPIDPVSHSYCSLISDDKKARSLFTRRYACYLVISSGDCSLKLAPFSTRYQ